MADEKTAVQNEEEQQEKEMLEKMTPAEQRAYFQNKVRDKFASGTLKLHKPMRARSQDVTELRFDFGKITGSEYASCMDGTFRTNNVDYISYSQSLRLFALAVEKCMRDTLDAKDVQQQLGIDDTIQAVKVTNCFFNSSNHRESAAFIDV